MYSNNWFGRLVERVDGFGEKLVSGDWGSSLPEGEFLKRAIAYYISRERHGVTKDVMMGSVHFGTKTRDEKRLEGFLDELTEEGILRRKETPLGLEYFKASLNKIRLKFYFGLREPRYKDYLETGLMPER